MSSAELMETSKIPPLKVDQLSVNRSGRLVLEDVCLTINQGEFVGLVGPNGGGKTTLLLTILGLLKHRKGNIELYGNTRPSSSVLRKLGWVSQHASNIPKNIKLTVRELVQLGTLNTSNMFWPFSSEQNEQVDQAIELAGLKSVENRNISKLSGGQRQRAVIARVLASKAEFILLDEPLVGIDRESRNALLKFLDNLCHQAQKTILMISHDIAAIQQASHRMVFLEEKIRYDGAADCFPDLADLANLRGIKSVHDSNYSDNTLYQLEDMGEE
jgi:zinc transport system ATP-binding protein|tara:strand:- start:968 stop:1783 length:816 start_codon:yes stop_codon:yes gene_type:complete